MPPKYKLRGEILVTIKDGEKDILTKTNQKVYGSDLIALALRELGIPYACLNPGASYRGLHDSVVNFLGNEQPQMLINLHEEHSISMAHGYAMVTGKPLLAFVHSNVGLMHATMAIFNSWIDRHPMVIIGATGPLNAEDRRPFIDWIHTSQDQGALIRDYIKWDDQPGSPEAAVESIRKGYQIACTPPCGPVYICLDAGIQEMELKNWPNNENIIRYNSPPPPGTPSDLLDTVANILVSAKKPLILCGRIARSKDAWDDRIIFAEKLGAKTITNTWQEIGFPTGHPLHVGMTGFFVRDKVKEAHREADVVLSLDWFDLGGTLKDAWDGGTVEAKIINCSMDFHQHRGWNKDYGVLPPVDIHIPTIPEVLITDLLALLDSVKAKTNYVIEAKPIAELPNDGPIGVYEFAQAYRNAARGFKICLISHTIGWPAEESEFNHYLACLANAGGGGLGAGPGNAVGAALALRDADEDCVPVAILGDGDYLMGVQALWTAAHQNIPLLIIVSNNRSYFNDEMHQEAVAKKRGRPVENRWIGQRIDNPEIDICALAEAQGLQSIGPVSDMNDLPQALDNALRQAQGGATMVMDVRIEPEYAVSPVHER